MYDLLHFKEEPARTTKCIDALRIQLLTRLSVTCSHCPFPILGHHVEDEDITVESVHLLLSQTQETRKLPKLPEGPSCKEMTTDSNNKGCDQAGCPVEF